MKISPATQRVENVTDFSQNFPFRFHLPCCPSSATRSRSRRSRFQRAPRTPRTSTASVLPRRQRFPRPSGWTSRRSSERSAHSRRRPRPHRFWVAQAFRRLQPMGSTTSAPGPPRRGLTARSDFFRPAPPRRAATSMPNLSTARAAASPALQISYNVEKYRGGINPAGFRIQLFYSLDGNTWTSAGSNFLTSFAQDPGTVNSGFTTGARRHFPRHQSDARGHHPRHQQLSTSRGIIRSPPAPPRPTAQALAIDDISILGVGNTQTNPTAHGGSQS